MNNMVSIARDTATTIRGEETRKEVNREASLKKIMGKEGKY